MIPPYIKPEVRRTFNPDEPIALTIQHTHGYACFELNLEQAGAIADLLSAMIQDVQLHGYYGEKENAPAGARRSRSLLPDVGTEREST